MKSSKKIKRYIAVGIAAGLIYPVFGDGFDSYIAFVNGLCIGLFGALLVSLLEIYFFDRYLNSNQFLLTLFSKTIACTLLLAVVIIFIKSFNDSLYYSVGYRDYVTGDQFKQFLFNEDFDVILIYSLVIIGLITFSSQISRKMGRGVLANFISGKYHTPKKEEIVLMFIDLKSSTHITESLGAEKYHQFINEFHKDISDPIIRFKGRVYRYVGDQIVIFWKESDSQQYLNVVGLFYDIKNALDIRSDKYLNTFGYVPEFRACCHQGELVLGEIGDVKSQIVFHGPTLYECEAIEKKCKELGEEFLISSTVHQHLGSDNKFKTIKAGNILRKGQEDHLELYRVISATQEKIPHN